MKENLKRVRTELEIIRQRLNEVKKRESIAQEELQEAQKEVFRLEHEQQELEEQIKVCVGMRLLFNVGSVIIYSCLEEV